MSFKSTSETRLWVLQFKILHNIYPTNILLRKMNITHNAKCSYCPETTDFIEHFFFSCPIIYRFWKDIELYILNKIGKHIHLGIRDVLFGVQKQHGLNNLEDVKIVNHLILIGKMCISILKKTKSTTPIFDIFEKHCKLRNT